MLDFEFENPIHPYRPIVVTFHTEEENEYCEIARFRFNSKAFDSIEGALSVFAGLVGNNFCIETSFGYMSVRTDEEVYYDDIPGVEGYAEIKNSGSLFDEYLNVELYYPEAISVDEIYRLLEEDIDIKSYKPYVEQVFDY